MRRRTLLAPAFALLAAASFVTPGRAATQKPPLHGRHWMAITGKPLGATAGAMMFQKGGNAVDAACAMLAATATMWDTLGWGGETQALVWHPQQKKVIGINALGVAPTGATVAFYHEVLQGQVKPQNLVPTRSLVKQQGVKQKTYESLRRYFLGMVNPLRPVFPEWKVGPVSDRAVAAEGLISLRNQFLEAATPLRETAGEFEKADDRLVTLSRLRAMLSAGFTRIKPAEFGLVKQGVKISAPLMQFPDVHGVGLKVAQGLLMASPFYWDMNPEARAFSDRFTKQMGRPPSFIQAGTYGAVLHYLKAVHELKTDADGAAVVAKMKSMPTEDKLFGKGTIRADGRKIHDMYLFEVKKPSESKGPWDYYKTRATIPAAEAFRPIEQGECPLAKRS